jgi:hypothetical protein
MFEHIRDQILTTRGIPELIAFGAGACMGYCDSKGVPMDPAFLGPTLYLTPPVVHAMATASGLEQGLSNPKNSDVYANFMFKQGASGVAQSITELGIGYGIGRIAGNLF